MHSTDGDLPGPVPASAPYWTAEAVSWLALLLAAMLVVVLATGIAR